MDRATLIDILLGVSALALMSATFVVVVLTIFGWNYLTKTATDNAVKIAQQEIQKFLSESNIQEMIRNEVAREAGKLYSDMDKSPTHDIGELINEKEKKNE